MSEIHVWDLNGPACNAGVGFISRNEDDVTCKNCIDLLRMLRITNAT